VCLQFGARVTAGGLGFLAWSSWFCVLCLVFCVLCFGFCVLGFGFGVWGLGFSVWGVGVGFSIILKLTKAGNALMGF